MAKEYSLIIDGHPSIYQPESRKLKIYYCEPENGVDKKTGIILLIPGFGGHANSNVYRKMRSQFADKYNLVTVQCDYFGWEFMQKAKNLTFNLSKSELASLFTLKEFEDIFASGSLDFRKLLYYGSKYNIDIFCTANLNEDKTNFNDMGIMQAIDNITSVLTIIDLLSEKGLSFNQNKIILYGHSHGGYLSYLCNAFAPNLFSLIVDISSWLYPNFILMYRDLTLKKGNANLITRFEYLARKVFCDEELLLLPLLYSKFRNKCKIISYHGTTDNMITHQEKKVFCQNIANCIYNEISESELDNRVFKSTDHGLDADFLELFDLVSAKNLFDSNSEKNLQHSVITYQSSQHKLSIDYMHRLPIVLLKKLDS